MHQRRGDATHENTLRLAVNRSDCKIDCFGDGLIFEGEERRNVDAVPRGSRQAVICPFANVTWSRLPAGPW